MTERETEDRLNYSDERITLCAMNVVQTEIIVILNHNLLLNQVQKQLEIGHARELAVKKCAV